MPPPPDTDKKGYKRYEIDAVIGHRIKKLRSGPREEYKVVFTGYGPDHNKWLPLENLGGCEQAIADYHTRRRAGIGRRAVAQPAQPSGRKTK